MVSISGLTHCRQVATSTTPIPLTLDAEVKKASKGTTGTTASLMELLRRNPVAGNLLPAAERLQQLQQDLVPLLPPGLAAGCEPCALTDGTLVLSVASAALAGKLKQTLPSLQTGLDSRGWKVNAIQLRIQPAISSYKSYGYAPSPKQAQLPPAAVESFAELAAGMPESPLKAALDRLVGHHREKRGL